MKIGFWVGYIKNLVLKLRKTACEKKVIIQVVSTVLVLVVAYCTQSFFFSLEPLNDLIGRVFGDLVPQNLLNGESIPSYRLLGPVFGVLLLWAVITVWSLKLGFRLGILVLAALLGLALTPFLSQTIEYVLNLIGCWMRLVESSTLDSCTDQSFGNIQNNLPLLAMSLPVLLLLWIFRTHDTRQLIKESIESRETSTYNNLLSTGLNLIASDDVPARCIGLVQLALVRRESPELKEQIDASTQNLTLYQEGKSKSESIKLSGAMLQNMKLKEAVMQGANLVKADLKGANLEGADLRDAHLIGADLKGANLEGANLQGARLEGADLEGAILVAANLMQAQLMGAKLTGADLERAIMIDANLVQTPLQKTDLKGANLKGARLDSVWLDGTILVNVDLTKSDFPLEPSLTWLDDEMKEDLRLNDPGGAYLEIVNILCFERIYFRGAKYDTHTKLPRNPEFNPDERGLIKVD